MFAKIRLEGSDKIVKIKLAGEKLAALRTIIASKLAIGPHFDLYYIDEEKEHISIREEADLELCFESQASLTSSVVGSPATNVNLIVKPLSGPISNSPVISHNPAPVQTGAHNSHYPAPPVHDPHHQHHGEQVTFTSGLYQHTPPPAQPLSSSLFSAPPKEIVHATISCDVCKTFPLKGYRYKSLLLNDYDLCEGCANLPQFENHTFIQIRYYNKDENEGLYSIKEYPNILKIFKGKLKDFPVNQEAQGIVKKLMEVFVGSDKKTIEDFVKKYPNKGFDEIFQEYIKKFHYK